MVDPLSIAASVAGLISLASEVTKACYGYYRKAKNAPTIVQSVVAEIKLLRKVLSDLEDKYDQRTDPLPALDQVMTELSECEEKLADFGRKIDQDFRNPQNLTKRLQWPFRDTEVRVFLNDLQRYRTVFESAKTNAILDVLMDVEDNLKSDAAKQEAVRKGNRYLPHPPWHNVCLLEKLSDEGQFSIGFHRLISVISRKNSMRREGSQRPVNG
jgi:Fungal N-terminal domain of STAND proteins